MLDELQWFIEDTVQHISEIPLVAGELFKELLKWRP